MWFKAIRAREPLPTTETEYVESQLWAPAGLIPTAKERAIMAGANGGAAERETTRTGGGP